MLRVGVQFEHLYGEGKKLLEAYLHKLLRQEAQDASVSSSRIYDDGDKRRVRRVVVNNKGDLVVFVGFFTTDTEQDAAVPLGDFSGRKEVETGRLRVFTVEDISVEGCSFQAPDEDAFQEGNLLHLTLMGEGFELSLSARVMERFQRPDAV